MGDPSHFNFDPVLRVAGNRYNLKEWLGCSVVPSTANFVKVKDPPLLIVFCIKPASGSLVLDFKVIQ